MSIRFEADGPVVLITIDRPHAMNALDPERLLADTVLTAFYRCRAG